MRQLINDLSIPMGLAKIGHKLYHNAQYLTAVVEVDEKAIKRWLPTGMKLVKPARADLFCAYFPDNVYTGAYHEAGLFVHIQVGNRTGVFCPWMILDDDRAMIIGRELLGYPKKMGEILWENDDVHIHTKASRRGTVLIEMQAKLGEVITDAPPILGLPHRNITGGLGLSLPREVRFTPQEQSVEVRRVEMNLRFTGTVNDPLHEMGLGKVIEARLHRVNLSAGLIPPIQIPRLRTPLFLIRQFNPRVL
ncbi:acetoacetate decarboxylase family protein [Acinetobacter sp.]|jgi:acetoacetate decarboxylase|uniref:Acetoacetate decarboxylase n=1 Tax=Acinetobacter bereziniae TaxID=106648 RepID=A0A833PIK4_ACIBZ|nr:acetoacetate decarboxylase family protein [Acinetobacter sp.]KAF1027911.1 MAG: Acetoacetate decarboxylase [Acinetobacter bereziniae]MDR0234965.1 acetoacetate decarboxylase family protein [Acinetobacter sp.]